MQRNSGLTRIGKMIGIKSLGRSLADEDAAICRDYETHQREIWGDEKPMCSGGGGGDEDTAMRDVMAAGDVHVYHGSPQSAQAPTPSTAQQTPTETGSIAKTLATIGLAAAGIGTGAALPIAAYNLTRPAIEQVIQPEPVTQPDTDTQYDLKIFREGQP